ncbi:MULTISPECIES: ribonuclease H-like domain-containing protein [Mycolicibacter]|uniref:Ribonuclease H-like domain-containing protein n=2 Tax=Mycolicibacter TaxID=1073531 RepID=A0ABU5XMF2_9MYCO|nr:MULTISPECIES: ribonuclease H-like domain-containing protein [unclassified Mycolicibacter]MEB3023368.1 ribonuclease H-like domain-containing protein [Mycolicibacter sp. MYC098]MEB3033710.1 ribonuclease H-like domain-containing protein [Mycolicibacter sp. MYC340]
MERPITLGGYPAKQCPRRTHNQFSPGAPPRPAPDPELQAMFDDGIAFEADIVTMLREQFAGSPSDLLIFDPQMDWHRCQELTLDALRAGVAIIVGGRLPDINGRVGAPDVLLQHGGGYLPVDVKHHHTMKPAGPSKAVTVSTLASPTQHHTRAGYSNTAGHWRDDTMQLAHYTRMLQDLGYHATSPGADTPKGLLVGGIIGTSDLTDLLEVSYGIVWYELATPAEKTYSATASGHRTLRSPLQRYDHEFAFRMKVAAAAQAGTELVRPYRTTECGSCEWFDYCTQAAGPDDASFALRTGHLNARQWHHLYRTAGIKGHLTVQQLATIDPAEHAEAFIDQSIGTTTPQRTLENAIRRARMTLAGLDLQPRGGSWPTPPTADIEVDFDIEWDTDGRIYQWGLRIRDGHDDTTARYQPIISFEALDSEREAALAAQFADTIVALRARAALTGKSLTVFHWSHPEISQTRKFPRVAAALNGITVDLLAWFNAEFFAITSSSLKNVAPLFGFQWGVDDPGGRASQGKIAQARQGGPDSAAARQWCLDYNESDVHAQAAIRDGIRHQSPTAAPARLPAAAGDRT